VVTVKPRRTNMRHTCNITHACTRI